LTTVKLIQRYMHLGIPVMIEIEGASLTPEKIPSILGCILEQLESFLDTFLSKTFRRIGGVPAQMDTPLLTALNQPQLTPRCELL